MQRTAKLLVLFSCLIASAFAQDRGLGSKQSKDDWEEINFEFNSSVLTDGFPSLLRLAELLQKHTDYKVRITGHTDVIGSNNYNERLGQRRGETVRDFLTKYGAAPGQVTVETRGKREPEQGGTTRDKYARWVNRRVTMTVTDGQGRTVGAGTINEVMQQMGDMPKKCCDDILARLDKLDDILKKLDALNDANAGLRRDLGAVRSDVDNLKGQVAQVGSDVQKRPTNDQVTAIVDKESYEQIKKSRDPRFSLLGMNVGADDLGKLTFTGKGRYFAPVGKLFGENFAVQAQGEYMYYRTQQEGQFDIGLVNRIGNFQAGLFSSFKHVNMHGMQNGGNLGQAALTADFLFGRGKVGFFGTKGFMDGDVINSTNLVRNGVLYNNIFTQNYLSIVDQVGLSTTVALFGTSYLEGNIGYLRSRGNADRPGGTLRFVQPVSNRIAITVEGGLNETLLSSTNYTDVRAGLQLGNFIKPKEFTGMTGPVPVDVPRIRYEVLTRTVRNGATPPVADAGPNQLGIQPGTVTLNGSGSYDPGGLAITFSWTQISGPSVNLNGANTATPTFTATAGNTYNFRLVVTNSLGLSAQATTTVSTTAGASASILAFSANPSTITAGQSSTLLCQSQNATTVTITPGPGSVGTAGTATVSPTTTTTYTCTATGSNGQSATATTTVTVNQSTATIISFSANPSTITAGQSTQLLCQTQNAATVTITPGVGNVGSAGTATVSPTATTTYTCTATSNTGQTATATTTVTVGSGTTAAAPVITSFSGNPSTITAGQSSQLLCQTQNATSVTITPGVGSVGTAGNATVSPTATTTYTCTATNSAGQSATATTTITVTPGQTTTAPVIASFTANPSVITAGQSSTLTWTTQNATTVTIAPTVGTVQANGSTQVSPTTTTTYTLTATNSAGSVTATATVTVNTAGPTTTPLTVTNCTASPANSTTSGGPVTLSYTTTGAASVVINNLPSATNLPLSGTVTVNPTTNTTYTLVATAANGLTAGCTIAVRVTPATTGGAPPTAIITGPQIIETPNRQLTLDASQSTNPGGGPLTYTWTALGTGAAILDQGQPTTRIQLGGLFGDYVIQLTVTNQAGQSATTTVTVRFVSTRLP